MTDLILGAADLYTWPQLAPWARSIISSGFSGEVILFSYRINNFVVDELTNLGISVIRAEYDHMAQPIQHTQHDLPTHAHTLRNFHMWQYLCDTSYDFVVITDTRDVYFQSNPQDFLEQFRGQHKIYLPSEGIAIEHEAWNTTMINQVFGPYIYNHVKDRPVCNSGTFFGSALMMKEVLLQMYLMAYNAGVTGMDQPILNILAHIDQSKRFEIVPHDAGWACQCGVMLDPTKTDRNLPYLLDNEPIVRDGEVFTSDDKKFVIVHQYDRVPVLDIAISKKCGM